ncbi:hypothetical protein [Altererythrobacter aquiaggeris]|uniref:hypothetical protein n=1 Tax=Aestuarierythrobacter aquiaggeris TaxID=1898396 RepID=UPI00301B5643
MFESRIIETAAQRGLIAGGALVDGTPDLRPLTWAEITARLAAAKELREALAGTFLHPVTASFDSMTAEQIVDGAAPDREDLIAINPDGLGPRKDARGIEIGNADDSLIGDRGTV